MKTNIVQSNVFSLEELNFIVQNYVYSKLDNSYNERPVYRILDIPNLTCECWRPYLSINKATDTDFGFRTKMQNENIAKYQIQVSNFGRIMKGDNILQQFQNGFGWLYVFFTPSIKYYVYRMVAEVWSECPVDNTYDYTHDNYWTVHHITNNGFDNRPCNLIWLSKSQHDCIKHNALYKNEIIRQEIERKLKESITNTIDIENIIMLVEDILSFSQKADQELINLVLDKYNIRKSDYEFINWENCLTTAST